MAEDKNESSFVALRLPKDMIIEIDKLSDLKLSNRSQIIREATKKGLLLIK